MSNDLSRQDETRSLAAPSEAILRRLFASIDGPLHAEGAQFDELRAEHLAAVEYSRTDYASTRRHVLLASIIASGVVAALIIASIVFGYRLPILRPASPSAPYILAWVTQITAQESFPTTMPQSLVDAAITQTREGATDLVLVGVAGSSNSVSVRMSLPTSASIPSRSRLAMTVRADLAKSLDRFSHSPPPDGNGRDLLSLLQSAAGLVGDDSRGQIWLQTFGLGTVAPADTRMLLAADPASAVQYLRPYLPDFGGVDVYVTLSSEADGQPRLDSRTTAWRREFVRGLLLAANASVVTIEQMTEVDHPLQGAPSSPIVHNIGSNTVYAAATGRKPAILRLDTSATFRPDSAKLAVSRKAVLSSLRPLLSLCIRSNCRAEAVGHAARYGSSAGALALSDQRARVIAGLLRRSGITEVTSIGVGFLQPLVSNPRSAQNRAVVITVTQ
jgi:outer membrane protein OmpA-like peptidoglycan-associated protein